ncbi:ABC transporter permease [Clostridium magnum]|uniref:Putative iron export permease protein FetB n=1 Tax=Clostridium magnum DSM 2767 TaxID=1121326 RepID=A0A162SE78_9CLOT|nr:iron export ABC transporter permease subunit FetB [Clostridium magnum]KZL91124.1 putative iron export permease protein FetB [Clostridium magnum DSM 2767]SHI18094.1 putative ABC transport system permease protein [Clostridium magnum DSM 2767]
MNSGNSMNISSLIIASSLIFISVFFSYFQKLKLEKEILIGVVRAVIQLVIIGYILSYIFGLKNPIFTTLLLLFMIYNASGNAAKRGKGIHKGLTISFIAISCGTTITLAVLVISGAIKYQPYEIIPVGGMIISNSMIAIGLCYKQLLSNFKNRRDEVQTKLALGADILPSSIEIVRDSIKTGMIPTIDSMRTLGTVSLPGMMTGLILAGTSPLQAIRFQIMVTFMLLSTTSIATFIACYLSYKYFFNDRKQLI